MGMYDVSRERIHSLNSGSLSRRGPVVYWMSRDQRIDDNWAMIHALNEANRLSVPCFCLFCLVPTFLEAQHHHFLFMIDGLREAERRARILGISFFLVQGDPAERVPAFLEACQASVLITDFDPLRIKRLWKNQIRELISITFQEVDAHNIVPCRSVSMKQEYSAFTFRKKVMPRLHEFLTDFPPLVPHKTVERHPEVQWPPVPEKKHHEKVMPLTRHVPGFTSGMKRLQEFMNSGIDRYNASRNDPLAESQSDLSPWLHFGQISAQRIAREMMRFDGPSRDAFLEQLIVRRELTDNFCYYNPHYDSLDGAPDWARKTLDDHREDPRDFLYSFEQFERAETHDPLWNAAQREMMTTGKMHGYLRMFWAKKILEWTAMPEEAFDIAITLNNRYELDGRDPNGYVGILWSIAGLHDRPWFERPVYGKIRYMNANGARRKFNVDAYIAKFEPLT